MFLTINYRLEIIGNVGDHSSICCTTLTQLDFYLFGLSAPKVLKAVSQFHESVMTTSKKVKIQVNLLFR